MYLRLATYWRKVMKLGTPVTLLSSTLSTCLYWQLLFFDHVQSHFSSVSQQKAMSCVVGFFESISIDVSELKKQSAWSKELHWCKGRVRPWQVDKLTGITGKPKMQSTLGFCDSLSCKILIRSWFQRKVWVAALALQGSCPLPGESEAKTARSAKDI